MGAKAKSAEDFLVSRRAAMVVPEMDDHLHNGSL
jgi:hypothetical protein